MLVWVHLPERRVRQGVRVVGNRRNRHLVIRLFGSEGRCRRGRKLVLILVQPFDDGYTRH